jgi:hypothetical protein
MWNLSSSVYSWIRCSAHMTIIIGTTNSLPLQGKNTRDQDSNRIWFKLMHFGCTWVESLPDTGYPEWDFSWFSSFQPWRTQVRPVPQIRPRPILSNFLFKNNSTIPGYICGNKGTSQPLNDVHRCHHLKVIGFYFQQTPGSHTSMENSNTHRILLL